MALARQAGTSSSSQCLFELLIHLPAQGAGNGLERIDYQGSHSPIMKAYIALSIEQNNPPRESNQAKVKTA